MSEGVVSPEVGSPSTDAGRLLRQAREARRLSVEDIAQALKLTPKQVVAIERDEFDLLPGKTFARGFVKNYARLLQVDPAPLLTAVDAHVAGGEVDLRPLSNAAGRMPASSSASGVPRVLLAGLVIAALALGVGVYLERFGPLVGSWQAPGSDRPAPFTVDATPSAPPSPEISNSPPEASGSPASNPTVAVTPAAGPSVVPEAAAPAAPVEVPAVTPATESAAPTLPTAASMRRLSFRFDKESWVEIRDGLGKTLVSRLNSPGSTLDVEGQGPFALVVGNSASVQLKLDDQVVDLKPHTSVSVARFRLE